jgi:hypothetical protein
LAPRLVLKGELVAKGYGVGAVVQIVADVTAWDIDERSQGQRQEP